MKLFTLKETTSELSSSDSSLKYLNEYVIFEKKSEDYISQYVEIS